MVCVTMHLCGKVAETYDIQAESYFLNLRPDSSLKADFHVFFVASLAPSWLK
jgi:hypothetical protein